MIKKAFFIVSLFLSMAMSAQPLEETQEKEPAKFTNLALWSQAAAKLLPQALQVYQKEGYEAFEKYLARVPDEIKYDGIFCKMIEGGYAYIFTEELKKRFKQGFHPAKDYFNKFCDHGKIELMANVLEQDVLTLEDTNLINSIVFYLINLSCDLPNLK